MIASFSITYQLKGNEDCMTLKLGAVGLVGGEAIGPSSSTKVSGSVVKPEIGVAIDYFTEGEA